VKVDKYKLSEFMINGIKNLCIIVLQNHPLFAQWLIISQSFTFCSSGKAVVLFPAACPKSEASNCLIFFFLASLAAASEAAICLSSSNGWPPNWLGISNVALSSPFSYRV